MVGRDPHPSAYPNVSLDLVTWTVGFLGGQKLPSVGAVCLLASFLGASVGVVLPLRFLGEDSVLRMWGLNCGPCVGAEWSGTWSCPVGRRLSWGCYLHFTERDSSCVVQGGRRAPDVSGGGMVSTEAPLSAQVWCCE